MACNKWRKKVWQLMQESKEGKPHSCDCKHCIKCLSAWKEDMQIRIDERKLKCDSEFFATFGVIPWTREQVKEKFRWLNTPQVHLMKSDDFYVDYASKLCCTLERLDTDGAPVELPEFRPMTLEVPQLELANVLDEYVREINPNSSVLLHRLRDVANEMQKYGDGSRRNLQAVHSQIISKCQAFMLQYKDMQHSRRNEPRSSHVPKHKKFDRIQDKIQNLKYESEWIDMFNKFNSDPLPPQDGEQEEAYFDILEHGPYCDCMECVEVRGYRTFRAFSKKKTVTGWTDVDKKGIPLEAWGVSVPVTNDKDVSDDDTDFDYNEDWFHHTDLATSSTSTDSDTSEIQLNTAYHKLMREVRGRQSRRENRDDTAGVEQKLLPPNIHKDKTSQVCRRKVFSAYDEERVVDGAMPSKMDKKIRRHFDKNVPNVDHWRSSDRIITESHPRNEQQATDLLEHIKSRLYEFGGKPK